MSHGFPVLDAVPEQTFFPQQLRGRHTAGVSLWGLHMGFSQGLLAALVADAAPIEGRGTAFGLFNLASGFVLLFASVIAGQIWGSLGAPATFYVGACFAGLALLGLLSQILAGPSRQQSGRVENEGEL